jgi:hypothetical protein
VTGQEVLARRSRRITIAFWLGQGLFVCGVVASGTWGAAGGAGLLITTVRMVGAAGACLTLLYAFTIGLRCPWCRSDLSSVLTHGDWSVERPEVRCCPHCGHDLNDTVPNDTAARPG